MTPLQKFEVEVMKAYERLDHFMRTATDDNCPDSIADAFIILGSAIYRLKHDREDKK